MNDELENNLPKSFSQRIRLSQKNYFMSCYISSIISLVDLYARACEVLTVVWGLDSDEGESENSLSCLKFGLKFDQFIQLNLVEGTDIITLVKFNRETLQSTELKPISLCRAPSY